MSHGSRTGGAYRRPARRRRDRSDRGPGSGGGGAVYIGAPWRHSTRAERIESHERNPKWQSPPLRIEMSDCINCDTCIRHCPPQFGAIFNHGIDVIIVPELCSRLRQVPAAGVPGRLHLRGPGLDAAARRLVGLPRPARTTRTADVAVESRRLRSDAPVRPLAAYARPHVRPALPCRRRARREPRPPRAHRRRDRAVHRAARGDPRPRRTTSRRSTSTTCRRPRTRCRSRTCCGPTRCGPSLDRDEVLAQAPAAEDGRFRVPRILGEAP